MAPTDPRFAHVARDARFRPIKRNQTKVKVDARFREELESADFTRSAQTDKYGRKKSKNDVGRGEDYYEFEDDDESKIAAAGVAVDRARGEGVASSSSDESDADTETDIEDDLAADDDDFEAVLDTKNVPTGEETSRRLAVVNLDWDNVKASDLFKLFESFAIAAGGAVRSAAVHPSEFGKERMAREQVEGPPKEIFDSAQVVKDEDGVVQLEIDEFESSDDEEEHDDDAALIDNIHDTTDEMSEKTNSALRKYQLDRLRYYYAVIVFDTKTTAAQVYAECDGSEFETSGNFLDLRFVPDDMEFDDGEAREICTEAVAGYEKKDFVTSALQHSKCKLTWDDEDPERVKILRRKFDKDELKDMDFSAYLASDQSEDDEEEQERAKKYRGLLLGDVDLGDDGEDGKSLAEPQGDMEISFAPGLSDLANDLIEKKRKKDAERGETVFERQMRERREKKKAAKKRKIGSEVQDAKQISDDEVDVDADDSFFQYGSDFEPEEEKEKDDKVSSDLKNFPATSMETLALLTANDDGVEHFSTNQVLKAEKIKRMKKKRGIRRELKKLDDEYAQQGFAVELDDRFKSVVDDGEFAIDVTNPNFKKTESMKKILEKRQEISAAKWNKAAPAKKKAGVVKNEKDELKVLAEAVKRKSKSKGVVGR